MLKTSITKWASLVFFLLVFFQIPLFRVPCKTGVCTTPLQITAIQLVASEVVPVTAVKVILYPGACVQKLVTDFKIPAWSEFIDEYNLTDNTSQRIDFHRLEILAGSYFAVAGSLAALIKPGRMSLFGTLLLVWGLIRESIFDKSEKVADVYVYPTIVLAVICAFFSVKYDIQKVQKLTRPIARPLKSSSKSKLR